ncbi:M28 family peptidase [candidate division KSB1 bacterium]
MICIKVRSLIFIALILVLSACFTGSSNAQYLRIEKKIPVVEEIVSKISLENVKEMHDKIVSFETRNVFSDTLSDTRGRGAAWRWIFGKYNEFKSTGSDRLNVYYDAFDQEPTSRIAGKLQELGEETHRLVNIVAMLPGKTDDIRYIVMGHFDTMPRNGRDGETTNPGANDDASGTIITMELARVLSQYEFDHTLMFIANDAEEQGLLGAHHIAQMALDEGWTIGGMITDDIIGNIWGGNGVINNSAVRVFSPDPIDCISRHWAKYAKYVGEPYVPGLKINLVFRLDRYGRGGDHRPFAERGFPGIRFTEMNEDYSRQHGDNVDTIEFVSREYMTQVARLQAAILANAANAPKVVTMMNPGRDRSDYSTRIRWTHDTEENDIAGYKVFIRKTDSMYWQEIIDAGMAEKQVLSSGRGVSAQQREVFQVNLMHRSIDDYIFGVSAYDNEGYESQVSTYIAPVRNRR